MQPSTRARSADGPEGFPQFDVGRLLGGITLFNSAEHAFGSAKNKHAHEQRGRDADQSFNHTPPTSE
jgi:hypothetical protein